MCSGAAAGWPAAQRHTGAEHHRLSLASAASRHAMSHAPLPCTRRCPRRCIEFDGMLESLRSRDGVCDVGLGAITITQEREDSGIVVSRAAAGWAASAGRLPGKGCPWN